MKRVLICGFVAAIAMLFSVGMPSQAMKLPKEILMNACEGKTKNPIYAPVLMPHQKHLKLGCNTCHHKWTDKKNPPRKCTNPGCHDILEAKGKQMMDIHSAYNAFHNRTSPHSCIGCHMKRKREHLATGPIACAKCHVKNK